MTELIVLQVDRPIALIQQCNVTSLMLCEADYVTRVIRNAYKFATSKSEVLR